MTETTNRVAVPVVVPKPDSRLEQLVSQFEQAKAEAAAAESRLKGIKDAIKAEMMKLAPDARRIALRSEYLAQPYRLIAKSQWRFDSKALKAVDPHTYVQYAYQTSAWYFEADK